MIDEEAIVSGVGVVLRHVEELVGGDWRGGTGRTKIWNGDRGMGGMGKGEVVGIEGVGHKAVEPGCPQDNVAHDVHDIECNLTADRTDGQGCGWDLAIDDNGGVFVS